MSPQIFLQLWKNYLARSSADSMGDSILSTVRKAAKLAVYEEIMMRVKNHHNAAIILVEKALKKKIWNSLRILVALEHTLEECPLPDQEEQQGWTRRSSLLWRSAVPHVPLCQHEPGFLLIWPGCRCMWRWLHTEDLAWNEESRGKRMVTQFICLMFFMRLQIVALKVRVKEKSLNHSQEWNFFHVLWEITDCIYELKNEREEFQGHWRYAHVSKCSITITIRDLYS